MKAKLVLSLLLLSNIFFTGVDKLQAQKLSGQEFWFTLPRMAPLQGNVEGLFLYIVSDYCVDDAYVEAPGLGYRQTFTVDRGSYTRLQIPLTVTGTPIYHNSPRQVENKGLFLKSEYPVVVYAVTYESASVDGEVIIPLNQLGKKYIVSNRGGIVSGQMRNTIVATEDNTDVEINTWDNANNPIIYNVTLNKGQTWQWSRTRANIAGDYPRGMNGTPSSFTGSVVNADKPIAIIGSIDCAGGNECGACENTFITHQPEKDWGTKHVTAQVIPRSNPALGASCNPFGNVISGDFIEVLGEVGTNVTINDHRGNRTATIAAPPYDAGAGYGYGYLFFEIPVNGTDYGFANTVITSDKPVQVTQHPKGWQTDSQGSSDPEAIAVFPTKTWTTSYIFAILSTATTLNNDFTLIVDNSVANAGDPQPINNFEYDDGNLVRNVNNVPGATAWVRIGTSNYFYKRIPSILNTNTLRIYSRTLTPFGIYTSSRGQAESYIQGGGDGPILEIPTCPICPVADFDKKEDVCIGVEAEFTDLSDDDDETGTTSITTWEWDFGDGTVQTFTSSTNPTHIYSAPGVYQVTLTVTNDNQNPGPCSISITKPITIFDGPNADAGVDKTICFEETAVIGGTPTGSGGNGVLTYNWKPSGGLNNRTTSNPSASPAATTEYIVEVQDTAGCIQRDTMNLVVNPKDSAYIADPDYTICFNNTVPVEIVITGGNSSSYTITLSNGNNSVTRNDLPPTGGLINVPFNTGFPNGFNVTITSFTANDPNICAVFNTEATPVIVRRIPDPNFKKDTLKVCEGESGTALIDFQGSGPYAFDISGGGNTDSYDNINSNPYEAALNAATTTTFTISNVRYANDPACPSNKTDQIVLQVLQNPDPGEDGQISICDGTGLLDLKTVLGGNPSPNGTWRDLNGSGALVNGNFDPNRAVEGEYQFEYTVSAGPDCDQLTSIATVDYNEPPKFQDLVEDCSEQLQDYKVRFTAFGGDPDSYTSAGGTFSGTGAFRVFESTADYPTKTSYTISFDDANGCGPVTITGFKNCGCFTNSGTMNTSLKEFCETDVANLTFNDDSVLVTPTNGDPKDTLYFVLHEGSGKSIVNPVDSFQTPSFSFKAGMQYGKTYYLSPVAGRPLPNGSIDYDPQGCVSVGQGAPVKFFREPTITANELQQDVCDGDPVRIALNFTGSAPYNLSMIEQSSGDTLSYTNLGQRDTIQLVPDNSETYNIFKIGDKYCTDVMVMESVNFVLHQPVDSVPGTLVFNCTRDAAFYTVEIQLSGDPASMTVNPSSAGTIDGSTGIFTSAPLANKSNYSFTFSDQYNCGSFTLSGTYECPCITAAGTIVEDTVQVCRNSPISFTKNTSDSVHDPNDDFVFIVYSNPNDPIGSILLEKKTTTFPIEAPLVPDVFYYASMVMGNQNGAGGVNYNDPCLDITPPVVIRWNGLPSADYAGSDQRINLCLGSEFKFPFDLAGNGPFALEYKIDGGSLVYDTLYNQPSDTFRITPADDDSLVFVRVIDGFGCQRAMDDTLVANVLPSPTMSVLNGGDTTVCAGETIEIKLSVNFNQSYSWQLIDTITNTIIEDDRFANEQTLTLSNIVANSNMVLKPINLEDAVCTGVASGTKAVFVTQNPSFTMGTSPDICEGESTKVEVTVSGGVSPFEIDVEGPGGFSQTFPIVSGDSIELPGFVPGVNTYTGVEIRDASSNKQCVGTGNSTSYTVNPLPDLSLVSVTSEVCTGDDIPFVVSTTGSGNDFSIHVTGSSGLDSIYTGLQNGNNDLVFPGSDNGQTVTINVIRVTDELGCTDGFNESGQVTQFDRPVINFSFNNAENCAPLDLEVYPSIQTPANSTCTWTFEDGQVFNSCNAPFFPKIEMVGGIDLNVRVETDQGCFTDTTFVDTVIVQPNPDARFVFDPAIPTNLLHVVSFENRSDLADNSAWFFDTLGMSFDRNPTFEFPVTPNETYDVKLVVSTSFGCTDSITRELTVEPDLTFYIPNSFTPNGDGTNDIFKPVLTLPQESLLEYEFYVFNRWGEQLFYSDQIDEGWDGQFNGKTVSKGGYTYMVKARVITSTETIRKYGMVIVAD